MCKLAVFDLRMNMFSAGHVVFLHLLAQIHKSPETAALVFHCPGVMLS